MIILTTPHITMLTSDSYALMRLLQLASPALPVGAYSYSEGLESVIQAGRVNDVAELERWLVQELSCGAIRLEASVIRQVYQSIESSDFARLKYWNDWLSALRETTELREQSWQMGRSLTRLCRELEPAMIPILDAVGDPCNFAIAFAITAAHWQIALNDAVLGFLHSWATNLVNAGIRLIPLGQTQGQQLLLNLNLQLEQTMDAALSIPETEHYTCSWGMTLASMTHETLYSRLFRS